MNIQTKSHLFLLLLLFFLSGTQIAGAQDLNIVGDTIFVNAEAEVMVRFPTLPSYFNTVPSNAPYNFKTAGTGFTIIAKEEKTKPAPLFVTEGGRNHKFVIVFKKNIDYNNDAEIDYDFSTTKKIEQHIRDVASMKVKNKPEAEVVKTDDKKEKKKKNDKKEENNAANYYAFLEEGDLNIKKNDLAAAKQNFEKALALRPNDQIPKQRLDEIRILIADKEKNASQEKNKQYVEVTGAAKANLGAKKYTQAQEGYAKALEIKPGDIYATHQLEKIRQLINDETNKKEKQKLTDLYTDYIKTGDKAFKKNELTDARIAYEQALVIKQNDPVAVNQLKLITEKEKKQTENNELENNYNNTISIADKLFKAGDYEEAKTAYNKANSYIKKQWPQDQVKKIDKILTVQLTKENTEKQKRLKQLETDQKTKEKEILELNYNAAIKAADNYFKAKDYANATIAYNKAISIDKRSWPQDQLKAIQNIKDQEEAEKKKIAAQQDTEKQARERKKKEDKEKQAREKEYKSVIQDADKYFKKKDYQAAKDAYLKATALSTESRPKDQIAAINKIIADQIAKDNAEKLRLAQEAEITAKYTTAINSAKAEFDKGNYIKARKLYTDAADFKPAENLPKEKLALIQTTLDAIAAAEKAKKDSLAAAVEMKKKYVLVMSKAKSYYLKDDLANAKNAYTEASTLNPGEAEPKNQLKAIQLKLDELAKANEINIKFDQKVSLGDSLLILKSYDAALGYFKEALTIKPSEYYVQTQINYIQAEIRNQQKEKEDRAKLEAYKKEEELDQKYRDALKRANQAVLDKKYDVAKAAYTEVLSLRPDNDYAQQRLKIVNYQMEKENIAKVKEPAIKKPVDNNPVIAKKEDKKVIIDSALLKAAPLPYSPAELKVKYPNIDFTVLPPEQPFNEGATNSLENATIFRDIILETPRLDISTTENKIKLTCQGINFEGANTYIKFLIQNNDKSDFLTGAMMLTWTKRSGSRIKLYPIYLYPAFLPIVTPGKEAIVIYVCKSYYINDNEKLSFELTDRLNKIKLAIDIPGTKYNTEEGRY